ncbi:hypothetical protein HMPREF1982_03093 [Clostridiales bacterium oral taxon 876 str. F0540]|nr:hypothetical protein HMPREF1982_03093 [Clostridiales bacterium oral taxon 876 str. F0540]
MAFIKEKTSLVLNPIINQATDLALGLMDKIIKTGFIDYSVPRPIAPCINTPNTKDKIMECIEQDPLNIELRSKLMKFHEYDFEMKAYSMEKEICELLQK